MAFIVGKTVSDTFLQRIAATPDLIGFKHKVGQQWQEVTFGTFYEEVKKVSYGLMNLGVTKGDRVAILANTRFEWSVCDMAILGAAAVTVPIYPSNTAADVAYVLNHSEALVLILEDQVQLRKILSIREESPQALPHLKSIVILDSSTSQSDGQTELNFVNTYLSLKTRSAIQEARQPSQFESNLREAEPLDPLSIVYTSGTTGVPKGAIITHDNVVSVMEDAVAAFSSFVEQSGETTLSFLPFSHIFGKFESLAGYTFGWKQAFAENLDKLLGNMSEIQPTIIMSVPRTFEKAYSRIQARMAAGGYVQKKLFNWAVASGHAYFAALGKRQFPPAREIAEYMLAKKLVFGKITNAFGGKLRYVICGGAPLAPELGKFFQIAGVRLLEGYGLTETCGPVSVNLPDDTRFGTVGKPLPEVSIRIAADGEIEVSSRKIFPGYYKSHEETEQVMKDGWFKTGDIGMIDGDGFLHITDRKKDIIVTAGGKNIAPQRIESIAKGISWISQIVVVGDSRAYLVALLTLNREEVMQTAAEKGILFSEYAELIKHPKIIALTHQAVEKINAQLAKYETIKKFMVLPGEFTIASGELTPSLKVKRKVVESRYRAEIDGLYT